MANLRSILGTDKIAEKEGVWVNFSDDIELKIARQGNAKYKREMEIVFTPYKKALRNQTMSDNVAEDLLLKLTAKTILVDWKNVELEEGLVDYSPEVAYELLKEYPDLLSFVKDVSESMSVYKIVEDEESSKN